MSKVEDAAKPQPIHAEAGAAKRIAGAAQSRTAELADKGSHLAQELAQLTRSNMDALMASSNAAARAAEALTRQAIDYGQKNFERASTAFGHLAEARTATELVSVQSDYAQQVVQAMMDEAKELNESLVRLTRDIAAPILSQQPALVRRLEESAVH